MPPKRSQPQRPNSSAQRQLAQKHRQQQQQEQQQLPPAELPADDEYARVLLAQNRLLLGPTTQPPADSAALAPQQALLAVVADAFADTISREDLPHQLRQIKDLFLQRDFTTLFTSAALLPVYAAEYIPGRALCYRDIFLRIAPLRDVLRAGGRIVCLGAGNGAEILGIASALHGMRPDASPLAVHAQDLSSYGDVVPSLVASIRKTLGLGETDLVVETSVADLLDRRAVAESVAPLVAAASLVTAAFVLNELLATSKSGFAALVSSLLTSLAPGSLLLVIDSAGSFSEVTLGGSSGGAAAATPSGADAASAQASAELQSQSRAAARTYMAFDLLDAIKALRVVESYDAIWYRFDKRLTFPLKLNNMRYFLRLYQKI
ncbi:hypothetical protein HK105_203402 [Polyrhizophydium stewartii]|uniref:Uncharacterized protein n=1 Tax=Polyrhizophydium stewartii TaxID=2732419 RepID=A0ABR4NBQ9_9FUNG|nr:hypothetical protein HK105_002938 [Polyrhizophydium stewartii]